MRANVGNRIVIEGHRTGEADRDCDRTIRDAASVMEHAGVGALAAVDGEQTARV